MKVTNAQTSTNSAEICEEVFRISTPLPPKPALPGGFTFGSRAWAPWPPGRTHAPRNL